MVRANLVCLGSVGGSQCCPVCQAMQTGGGKQKTGPRTQREGRPGVRDEGPQQAALCSYQGGLGSLPSQGLLLRTITSKSFLKPGFTRSLTSGHLTDTETFRTVHCCYLMEKKCWSKKQTCRETSQEGAFTLFASILLPRDPVKITAKLKAAELSRTSVKRAMRS